MEFRVARLDGAFEMGGLRDLTRAQHANPDSLRFFVRHVASVEDK
jgi:hypothetical protein